jgi:two-component system chemotaxis response regulator CheB
MTIAQNEKSCVVFGMPGAAIEMNAIDKVLPLEKIAEEIVSMVS